MRSGFSILLITVLLFGGGYLYYVAQAVCPAPLSYSIGEIDESFNLTFDEVRLALSDAENVWEDATGQNLLTYDGDSSFSVNFIYDERQEYADAEGSFKEKLDKTQSVSDSIEDRYTALVSNYDDLQTVYSQKVALYEKNLNAHNSQVVQYNQEGGVTQDLYEALQERKEELNHEQDELNSLLQKLNGMVQEINGIGERGNLLVETYNKGVKEYNNNFGESREFTQGTYSSDKRIDIYTYADSNELRLVLAHEFGHALSLDHVQNEQSVMYFLIGKQPKEITLTQEDLDEFIRVCSSQSVWDTIKKSLEEINL
ncbi:MAG: putative Zn-dependent protease [Acidimicrobiales bacterium]|jgi:predicted Zn-dependent protease